MRGGAKGVQKTSITSYPGQAVALAGRRAAKWPVAAEEQLFEIRLSFKEGSFFSSSSALI